MKGLGCSDGSVTADGCWLSDPDVPCRCVNDDVFIQNTSTCATTP